MKLNVMRFGIACGLTGVLLYLGCIILMATVGVKGTVLFFNTLLHGLDVAPVLSMQLPWWQSLLGIVQTALLAYLAGATLAAIYNFSLNGGKD